MSAWVLLALAQAWDTRRIGYGNEGKHPFELEAAALLGMCSGFAAEHLASARERLALHELEIAELQDWRGPTTPIGQLVVEFGLSVIAVDILLVIAAAGVRGEIARVYGILANDTQRLAN